MADFQPAYNKLRTLEGYFLKDVDGETYAGITRKYNPEWIGWFFIDKYKLTNGQKCTDPHIENLIKAFYLNDYWKMQPYEKINNQQIATALFCQYVNSNTEAIVIMQRAVGVTDDGIMGNITLDAINDSNPQDLLEKYKDEYIHFYTLTANTTHKQNDLKGWIDRINKLC